MSVDYSDKIIHKEEALTRIVEQQKAEIEIYRSALNYIGNCTGDLWACKFSEAILQGQTIDEAVKVSKAYHEVD